MSLAASRRFAFTIVEILIVVGILGILLGLLLPALGGAMRKSAKNSELNAIRQVGYAWQMYASNNNDSALPGYLEIDVQQPRVIGTSRGWGVQYNYPTEPAPGAGKAIPPAPNYGSGDPNIAGPWTWRLLSFLDYSHEMVHGYADETDESIFELVSEAEEVALEPAFGYNGYYIGGYWEMQDVDGVATPFPRFTGHCSVVDGTPLAIPLSPSQIRRSSEVVTFCSSTSFDAPGAKLKLPKHTKGAHLSAPPTIGIDAQWQPFMGSNDSVEVLASGTVYTPIGRHTGNAAVLWADYHTDVQGFTALYDQRKWINSADSKTYTHNVCP